MAAPITAPTSAIHGLGTLEMLSGTNFHEWKEKLLMYLGVLEFDHCLEHNAPVNPKADDANFEALKATYDAEFSIWDKSNKKALMVIKGTIPMELRGGIEDSPLARVYMTNIENKFRGSTKNHISTLARKLFTAKYDGSVCIREHILQLSNLGGKLNASTVNISAEVLINCIFYSLPPEYAQIETAYNQMEKKWSIDELITQCVQEEDRLKTAKKDVVNLISPVKDKGKRKLEGPKSPKAKRKVFFPNKEQGSSSVSKRSLPANVCYFCKKEGHFQKDCVGFLKWLSARGVPFDSNSRTKGKKP